MVRVYPLDHNSRIFRNAYVIDTGKLFNYGSLTPYVSKLVFVLEGTERDYEIADIFENEFEEFDPTCDVIIPTGRVFAAFILGFMLRKFEEVFVGIYEKKMYNFVRISYLDMERMLTNDGV